MEQITRKEGKYFYGERECYGVDDAYCHFRDEYNMSVGRIAFKRLSRLGSRKERVHGRGFVFSEEPKDPGLHHSTVPIRLIGLVCGSYCWILGRWDMPWRVDDDNYEQWLDWAFSRNSGALVTSRLKK